VCECVGLNYSNCNTWNGKIIGSLSLVVRWLEHEADHSPPSSAPINEVYSSTSAPICTSLAQYIIMQGVKQLSVLKTHYGDHNSTKYSMGHNK
jgi:hypothetical protein